MNTPSFPGSPSQTPISPIFPIPSLQIHELTNALTLCRSDLSSVEADRGRLKELHSQVKAALQESYSSQQEQQKQVRGDALQLEGGGGGGREAPMLVLSFSTALCGLLRCIHTAVMKAQVSAGEAATAASSSSIVQYWAEGQVPRCTSILSLHCVCVCSSAGPIPIIAAAAFAPQRVCVRTPYLSPPPQTKELEELCAAQQNSLEEGEEKFRALQNEQDQLHHAALAAKAQLVTAQAQVGTGGPGVQWCAGREDRARGQSSWQQDSVLHGLTRSWHFVKNTFFSQYQLLVRSCRAELCCYDDSPICNRARVA